MNIVIISQYFPPEMGAPQNRLLEVAQGLQRFGWDVSVVTALPNYPTGRIFPGYRRAFIKDEIIEGVPTKRLWLFPSNSTKPFPRIVSMISFSMTCFFSLFFIKQKKADFLLVESPPLTLAFSGWILSLITGAKLVLNVSDLWPLSAKELGAIREGWFYSLLLKLERFLYRKAFICCGQSQEIVDYITRLTRTPVYLIRNGVNSERFFNFNFAASPTPRIVYAGLLGVAQGILSICKEIDFQDIGVEFHIYGAGPEKEALVSFLKNNSNRGIFYHGLLPRDRVPEILQTHDATLVSLVRNIYGAVPSKIYEALAAGLPIFFSGEGEGARLVKNNAVGWINDPGDHDHLQRNLRMFLSMSESEKEHLRMLCRHTAKTKFDRTEQVRRLHMALVNQR